MLCDNCGKRIRQSDATEVQNGDMVCLECLKENYVKCDDCDEWVDECDAYTTADGRTICQNCYEDSYFTCEDCGEIYHQDDVFKVFDSNNYERYVCEYCRNHNYTECECCNEYHTIDDMYETYDGNCVCQDCANNYYYTCEGCGNLVHQDEEHYSETRECSFCPNCWESEEDNVIYSYHSYDNFSPRKMGEDDEGMTFGFELEVSGDRSYAEEFLSLFKDEEIVLMNDSSISGDGFEIITQPMTENYFYEEFLGRFKEGLKFLREHGFESHNCGGLHIHMSEPSINVAAQLAHMLFNCPENEIDVWLQLTQRNRSNLDRWASFDERPVDFDELRSRDYHDRLTKGYSRYVALNYDTRTRTYEFRIFNGNLRLERFLKNFEIVKSLVKYCQKYERATIPYANMKEWLKYIDENKLFYQNLYEFINEKDIRLKEATQIRYVANGLDIEIPDIELPY